MPEIRFEPSRPPSITEWNAQSQNATPRENTATAIRTEGSKDSVDLDARKAKVQETREQIAKKQAEAAEAQRAAKDEKGGFWGTVGGFFGGALGALFGGPLFAGLGGLFGITAGTTASQKAATTGAADDQSARSRELADLKGDLARQEKEIEEKMKALESRKADAPRSEPSRNAESERYTRTY